MIEILASLFAGLGLFFTGVKMIGANLRQLASRRVRFLVSRWSDSPSIAALIGAGIHLIAQSGSAVVFLIISLISSGLLTVRKALPMMIWANGGGSLLVLFAVLNIHLFILLILGLAGISYYLEKPARHRTIVAVLFGIGLLFFGLQWLGTSVAPLVKYEWFRAAIFHSKSSNLLALAVGTILTFIVQSSAAVSLVAITMTKAGVLPVEQTIMIIYGTHIGSSALIWVLSANLKGSLKQIAVTQITFNMLTCVVLLVLFYIEVIFKVPLIKALVTSASKDVSKQMAYVYFIYNFGGAILFSFLIRPLDLFLNHFWPPTVEENKSKLKYIHERAIGEPGTAMDLVEKEQERLTHLIREHLDSIRNGTISTNGDSKTHTIFITLGGEIAGFIEELMESDLSAEESERLLYIRNRQHWIVTLEENVDQLAHSLARATGSVTLNPLTSNLLEGLETILLSAIDAMQSRDGLSILHSITGDRSKLMEEIRSGYFEGEKELSQNEKSDLLYMTNLFERSVWVLGQLGRVIESGERFSVQKSSTILS